MKLLFKIGVIVVALAGVSVVLILLCRPDNPELRAVEETRRLIRSQGFKTELRQFDMSAPPEERARAKALSDAGQEWRTRTGLGGFPRMPILRMGYRLQTPVGTNAALVLWRGQSPQVASYWEEQRDLSDSNSPAVDAACAAALSGPFRMEAPAPASSRFGGGGFQGRQRPAMELRMLQSMLAGRMMLGLRDGDRAAAWTNLLALTRLVTAWDIEPVEMSHMIRFTFVVAAQGATWQALQAGFWTDSQLGALQGEWETPDFLRDLPAAAAYGRVSLEAGLRIERSQPIPMGFSLNQWFHAPGDAWNQLNEYFNQLRYRHHGSYSDEQATLLGFRDREVQYRQAIQCPTWEAMSAVTGVTNVLASSTNQASRLPGMSGPRFGFGRSPLPWDNLLVRAAVCEARRRVVVCALALERYRLRHGAYPANLANLAPEVIQAPPLDFADGRPLRYCLGRDGRFLLYSIGLDLKDDGGQMRTRQEFGFFGMGDVGMAQGTDLVWPRPASEEELQAQARADEQAAREEVARSRQARGLPAATPEEMQAEIQSLMAARQRMDSPAARPAGDEQTNNPGRRGGRGGRGGRGDRGDRGDRGGRSRPANPAPDPEGE